MSQDPHPQNVTYECLCCECQPHCAKCCMSCTSFLEKLCSSCCNNNLCFIPCSLLGFCMVCCANGCSEE